MLPRERELALDLQLTVQRARMDLMLDRNTTDREVAWEGSIVTAMREILTEYGVESEIRDCFLS